jgi:glycosyltransferase involved in cell wall biosynthesis
MPRFSVVIPTYNRAHTLGLAVRSVLSQSLGDFEVIVVDDGSTDDTLDAVRSLEDPRIRLVAQQHRGVSAARNAGVREAAGDYVTFLDSDDEALPRWLEFLDSARDSDRPIIRCGLLVVGPDDLLREILLPGSPNDFVRWVNTFRAGTYALRRDLLVRLGPYPESLGFGEHTELAMRLAERGLQTSASVATLQRPLIRARRHGGDVRYGSARIAMAEYALREHGALLRSHPRTRATYFAIVGVNAARQGDFKKAGKNLARAWLAQPWRPKPFVRLMASTSPAIARRVWRHTRIPDRELPRSARDQDWSRRPSRPGSRPQLVSVIIPAHDAAGTLPAQMEALAGQTYRGEWEVIVVDNRSTDGTDKLATEWRDRLPRLRVVTADERKGASYARNIGSMEGRGDFLAFCDADDLVSSGWLEGMAAAAERADLVGGAVELSHLNTSQTRAGRLVATDSLQGAKDSWLPYALSANCGVWRDVYWSIGGWNELFPGPGEDVDFSWRAQLAGFDLGFGARALVHYRLREELGSLARQLWSYALTAPAQFRIYREAGMPRRDSRLVLKQWAWVLSHLPDLVLGADRRRSWLRVAARSAAYIYGSFRFRVVYL